MGSKVICLMGPTAAGKTDLSLQLANALNGEIVSVDSAMVYQGMDIGTAKPSLEERKLISHHLIDIVPAYEPYSAAKFCEDAITAIQTILARDKTPILVGGTMLYFKALQKGLAPLPGANVTIREKLAQEASLVGWPAMHARLEAIDPISAERIKPSDPQRIQRALEVYEITKQPLSSLWRKEALPSPSFDYINLAIAPEDRSLLHRRIAERFHKMITQGFIDEVATLYASEDMHSNLPAIRSVGYRQVWQYLDQQITYEEMTEMAIAATRQLAKRQITWLRYWEQLSWFESTDPKLYVKVLKNLGTNE